MPKRDVAIFFAVSCYITFWYHSMRKYAVLIYHTPTKNNNSNRDLCYSSHSPQMFSWKINQSKFCLVALEQYYGGQGVCLACSTPYGSSNPSKSDPWAKSQISPKSRHVCASKKTHTFLNYKRNRWVSFLIFPRLLILGFVLVTPW